MAKPTAVQNIQFHKWLSANHGGKDENFYFKVGGSLFISEQFTALSNGAKWLYLSMAMQAGKKSRFTFSKKAAERYGISYSTLCRRVNELEEAGFLTVDRAGTTREYNYYTFSTKWKPTPEP